MISRLAQFIEFQNISVRAFEKKISASDGMIRRAIGNNTDIQSKWITNIAENYPDLNIDWLITGHGTMLMRDNYPQIKKTYALESTPEKGIPLIPTSGFAGFGQISFQDLQIEHYYDVPEFKQADFLMRIKGNSMYPKYSSGDIIACTIVAETLFFQWNKIYAIHTKSQGVLVKRVKKSSIKDCITLVSDNQQYDPFDVPITDIGKIALVIGVIRVE
jgi:phage repressor protein C with HTH and peptisase S24 domain